MQPGNLAGGFPLPFFESFDLPSSPNETSENTFYSAGPLLWSTQRNVWSPPSIPENNNVSEIWRLSPEIVSWQEIHLDGFQDKDSVIPVRPKPTDILSYFKPWRRMGFVIWDSWRMYTVGLCHVKRTERMPTPDGEFLEAELPGIKAPDKTPRWLALVGTGYSLGLDQLWP